MNVQFYNDIRLFVIFCTCFDSIYTHTHTLSDTIELIEYTQVTRTWYDSVVHGVIVEQYTHVEFKFVGIIRYVSAQPLPYVEVKVLHYISATTAALALFAFARICNLSWF